MQVTFTNGTRTLVVEISRDGARSRITVDGREVPADVRYLDDDTLLLEVDGARHVAHVVRRGRARLVALGGEVHHFAPADETSDHAVAALAEPEIKAPMPGKVLEVLVEAGSHVEAGDGLLILEAMKMENRLTAQAAGIVAEVRVVAGQMVVGGEVLAVVRYE